MRITGYTDNVECDTICVNCAHKKGFDVEYDERFYPIYDHTETDSVQSCYICFHEIDTQVINY